MPTIDRSRLLADLRTLRSFGATGPGVVRPSFSDIDMEARRWLQSRMQEAGLTANIDGAANVIGRSPNDGPALVIGSHSDTQPTGGWLDGALGVIYGIEVARSLLEDPATAHLAVDAVAWCDEEGTYSSCVGSKSFCGVLTADDYAAQNVHGESVAEALDRVGLASVPQIQFEPGRHIGYLEAHIEQGPHLENAGLLAGVVTSIVGIGGLRIGFTGEQNHAGTTPMHLRKDAGVALFEFATRARERIADVASDVSVWTFGSADLTPGAESIIPGHASLLLQFRDPDSAVLSAIDAAVRTLARELTNEGPVLVEIDETRERIAPTVMDTSFQEKLADAAQASAPGMWTHMPSAAGHDAMVIAHHLPCGMLFIPSINGVSHDFAEDTNPDDIARGCQILADAAASILSLS